MRLAPLLTALLLLSAACLPDRSAEPPGGAELTLQFPPGTSASQIEAAQKVLAERIHDTGWEWHRFEPMPGSALRLRVGPLDPPEREVLVRLLTRPYAFAVAVLPEGEPVPDEQGGLEPLFTDRDIEYAYLKQLTHGGTRIHVELKESASAALFDATRSNLGGHLAMFADGRRVAAPTLHEAIRGGLLRITMPGTDEQQIFRDTLELGVALRAGRAEVVPTVAAETGWGTPAR